MLKVVNKISILYLHTNHQPISYYFCRALLHKSETSPSKAHGDEAETTLQSQKLVSVQPSLD
jgi:hypothetical protein